MFNFEIVIKAECHHDSRSLCCRHEYYPYTTCVGYTEELLFSGCFPATGKAMVLHWKLNGLIRCSWMPGLFMLNWLVCYIVVAIVTLTFHILGKTLCLVCIWMYGCHCWSKLLDFHVAYYRCCCCCCCYCCIEVVFRGSAFGFACILSWLDLSVAGPWTVNICGDKLQKIQ